MFKKTLLAVSVGLAFSLSGCGGGSSDGDPTPQAIVTGTGYYVDSAVSGVNTKCGAVEGTTGTDGKFTFEVGKGCTFFLGDIKLRDIDKAILKDGVTVYETDKYTAQVLQSLDSDGNPTNGITISDDFVTALKTASITALPTNEAETTAMLAVIEAAGGTVVTQIDAQGHAYSALISGKDLYTVDVDGDNSQNLGPIVFKADGSVTGIEHPSTWRFDGDKLYVGTGSEYHQVMSVTPDYILFKNFDEDGGTTRAYFDEAKARAFMATLSQSNNIENQYTVFAGNTYFSGGLRNLPSDFIELGKGTGTTVFNGSYKYYVIANKNSSSTIFIDAAEGSNGVFYGTNTTSNTGDTWSNLAGSPDNSFVSIGAHGYTLIDAKNDSLTSLTVVGK